jgi:hypothetical protein
LKRRSSLILHTKSLATMSRDWVPFSNPVSATPFVENEQHGEDTVPENDGTVQIIVDRPLG